MGEHYDIGGGRERYLADLREREEADAEARREKKARKRLHPNHFKHARHAIMFRGEQPMEHYGEGRDIYNAVLKETAMKGELTKANAKQVGGKHYQSEYQHWDLVLDYGLHYLESCATKYVTRRKGSRGEDIGKAIHYLEKLVEELGQRSFEIRGEGRLHTATPDFREQRLKDYSLANRLTFREHVIMKMIVIHYDYDAAIDQMKALQKEV